MVFSVLVHFNTESDVRFKVGDSPDGRRRDELYFDTKAVAAG